MELLWLWPKCTHLCNVVIEMKVYSSYKLHYLNSERPDAWIRVCDALKIDPDVRETIQNNTSSNVMKFLNVAHYLYLVSCPDLFLSFVLG